MKCQYKKGFTLIEAILSFNILLLLIGIVLYSINHSILYKKAHVIQNNLLNMIYNVVQIIKSDSYFYLHPENYFEDPNNFIYLYSYSNVTNVNLYFNDLNELVSNSEFIFSINIVTHVYSQSITYSIEGINKYKSFFEEDLYTNYEVKKT